MLVVVANSPGRPGAARFVSFIGTALALIMCLKATWHVIWQMMLCDIMGRNHFFFFFPPLIMATAHRLDSDLRLVLCSDFTDLCWHVKERKAKMSEWIHIQSVVIRLKVFCELHLDNTNDFTNCKSEKWRRK